MIGRMQVPKVAYALINGHGHILPDDDATSLLTYI
jgi:hypothetical protein